MTNIENISIKTQLEKPQVWFCKYFPARIKNVGEDAVAARRLVWGFKDAKAEATEKVAQMTALQIVCQYGEDTKNMTFICVPASSQEKNESRYKAFCQRVSELSGIRNGYELVKVSGERLAVHEHRHNKNISKTQIVEFDTEGIMGTKVCIFDDVITTGHSYGLFADQIEKCGAQVLGGIFLGRTFYRYNSKQV